MNDLQFTGKITAIKKVRTGKTEKGEWANAEFEVTEDKDQYPQIALFDFFKNGEYVSQAQNFAQNHNVGDEVTVHFNLKKNNYTKDGEERSFYKTSAWKIDKASSAPEPSFEPQAGGFQEDDDPDNLPF